MSQRTIKGHPGIGTKVTGIALVAKDSFSARYDLDRKAGIFARPGHALEGESYVDRVVVLDKAKGGVATAWMFGDMSASGKAPKALLLNAANPIMAQGAAFSEIALMHGFETDITDAIRTGDAVTVDPAAGTVTVRRG
jgi:predicted aconitase with swiveling domain